MNVPVTIVVSDESPRGSYPQNPTRVTVKSQGSDPRKLFTFTCDRNELIAALSGEDLGRNMSRQLTTVSLFGQMTQ